MPLFQTIAPEPSSVVYTPPAIARAMVKALAGVRARDLDWLEPSVGGGVFVRALARRHVPREKITALDLDPGPQSADRLAETLRPTEFLEWAATTQKRFDRIVGNPPYVAVRSLPPSLRSRAAMVATPDGEECGLPSLDAPIPRLAPSCRSSRHAW